MSGRNRARFLAATVSSVVVIVVGMITLVLNVQEALQKGLHVDWLKWTLVALLVVMPYLAGAVVFVWAAWAVIDRVHLHRELRHWKRRRLRGMQKELAALLRHAEQFLNCISANGRWQEVLDEVREMSARISYFRGKPLKPLETDDIREHVDPCSEILSKLSPCIEFAKNDENKKSWPGEARRCADALVAEHGVFSGRWLPFLEEHGSDHFRDTF